MNKSERLPIGKLIEPKEYKFYCGDIELPTTPSYQSVLEARVKNLQRENESLRNELDEKKLEEEARKAAILSALGSIKATIDNLETTKLKVDTDAMLELILRMIKKED